MGVVALPPERDGWVTNSRWSLRELQKKTPIEIIVITKKGQQQSAADKLEVISLDEAK